MSIQVLKLAVVAMGALIVVGVIVMAVTIALRFSGMAEADPALSETIALTLPAGATIVETALDGDRLVVRLDTPGGPVVQLLDLASGRLLSTVVTMEAAP